MWQISLWLSIFALVSSAPERLLAMIPDDILEMELSETEEAALLRIVLTRPGASLGQAGHSEDLVVDLKLLWVWQSPMMLMSLSWVTFLMGYTLYGLTPLIQHSNWTVDCTASFPALPPPFRSTLTLCI